MPSTSNLFTLLLFSKGRWEDEVIWDHENMPVKLDPKIVSLVSSTSFSNINSFDGQITKDTFH